MHVRTKQKPDGIQTLHLVCGFQSFGNSTTINASEKITLELFESGVLCTHIPNKKSVFVPHSNIKGIEVSYGYKMGLVGPSDKQESDLVKETEEVKEEPKASKVKAKK